MNNTFIDTFFKWFFIANSIFYAYLTCTSVINQEPYFEYFISFLLELTVAVYFIKKTNSDWVKDNMFFILSTMTGLMMTKTFFFFHNALPYGFYAFLSSILLVGTYISFKKYMKEHTQA